MPVKKIAGRWQPVTTAGHIRRDATHNTDYDGYSTKQGALKAYREMDPLKAGLEREFHAGAPMPIFRKTHNETARGARRQTAKPPKKSHAQIKQEVDAILAEGKSSGRHPRNHATINTDPPRFAVEIDPAEFQGHDELPTSAHWRDDLGHLAEQELSSGRTHRRPRDARYTVIEWTGYRGALGRLLDWLEGAAGITRYAELLA